MIAGYDGAAPQGFGIDRARFERMLQLRKAFYSRHAAVEDDSVVAAATPACCERTRRVVSSLITDSTGALCFCHWSRRFCKRAAEEGGAPPDMAWFIDYINRWMAKHPACE